MEARIDNKRRKDNMVTYIVPDAIVQEHAISLASHQAYADGYGDWGFSSAWKAIDGQWRVLFRPVPE